MPNSDLIAIVLGAAEKPIVAFLENELIQNKAAIIAEAKKIESSAIVAIGATVISTLASEAHSPFFSLIEKPLAQAIEANEGPIIAALGGEDEALYALVLHEVETAVGK